MLRRVRRRTTTVGASPSTTSAASSSSSSSGSASPSSLLQLNTGQPHFPHFLLSLGVWFLLVLSRYYKYKAPSTRVSSVEVRTNKQIFFQREDVSEYSAILFPPLRSRRERRKTTERLSSGISKDISWEQNKNGSFEISQEQKFWNFLRIEVLKFLKNRNLEIS